jgi:hypothetical protein
MIMPDYVGRLPRETIRVLLAAAVRFSPVQTVCLTQIKPEHFDAVAEPELLLMWQAIQDAAAKNSNMLPEGDAARSALDISLKLFMDAGASATVSKESIFGASGLLPEIFGWRPEEFFEPTIRDILKQFLVERNNTRIATLVRMNQQYGVTQQRMDEVRRLMEGDNFGALDESDIFQLPIPTESEIEELRRANAGLGTGMTWIDKIMGGQFPGQCYTLIGPTGVGKTITATMLCTYGAKTQLALAKEGKISTPGIWYFVTYEQPKRDIQWRIMANIAAVDSKKLQAGYQVEPRFSNLQQPGEPYSDFDQYFMRRMKETPDTFPSEMERYTRALSEYITGINIVDCTGAVKGLGGATLQEIGAYIQARSKRGIPCAGVVIDWAGVACQLQGRRSPVQSRDPSKDLTMRLANFVSEASEYIAIPCDCPVWCLHQVTGAGNKAGPTTRRSDADAANCTTFSHLAYYAFALGTKDKVNNLCCCWASKTRNSESDANGTVLKIEGAIATLRDASREYLIDGSTFIPTNLADRAVRSNQAAEAMDDALNRMDDDVRTIDIEKERQRRQPPPGADKALGPDF